jgi:hypothetical protein
MFSGATSLLALKAMEIEPNVKRTEEDGDALCVAYSELNSQAFNATPAGQRLHLG